jgi:hypothetical protein
MQSPIESAAGPRSEGVEPPDAERPLAEATAEAGARQCPRCAYDVSAPILGWRQSCDVMGTCPECGLYYEWADVLNPERRRLAGFVEQSTSLLGLVRDGARTMSWAIIPHRFWSRVGMHLAFKPARILALGAIAFLVLQVATAAVVFAGYYVCGGSQCYHYGQMYLGSGVSVSVWHYVWPFIRPLMGDGPDMSFGRSVWGWFAPSRATVVDASAFLGMLIAWPLLFIVRKPGQSLEKQEILDFLVTQVAKWWVPDDVVFLESLPVGGTGKVQKNDLRKDYGGVFS